MLSIVDFLNRNQVFLPMMSSSETASTTTTTTRFMGELFDRRRKNMIEGSIMNIENSNRYISSIRKALYCFTCL